MSVQVKQISGNCFVKFIYPPPSHFKGKPFVFLILCFQRIVVSLSIRRFTLQAEYILSFLLNKPWTPPFLWKSFFHYPSKQSLITWGCSFSRGSTGGRGCEFKVQSIICLSVFLYLNYQAHDLLLPFVAETTLGVQGTPDGLVLAWILQQ